MFVVLQNISLHSSLHRYIVSSFQINRQVISNTYFD